MQSPSVTDIRTWSKFDFDAAGFAAAVPDPLDEQLARALADLTQITGLTLNAVAVEDEPLVREAIQGLTELRAARNSVDYVETLADFDLIASFSAGGYSETRRGPEDAMKARMLVPWPWLNSLLWSLMSDDRLEWWLAYFGGDPAPSFEVTEVDWGAYEYYPYVRPDVAPGW